MTVHPTRSNGCCACENLRQALLNFSHEMEAKLRKNDHKTGWRELPVEALRQLMMLEIKEFEVALEFFPVAEARKELVDIANFAMMLYDRLGLLNQAELVNAPPRIKTPPQQDDMPIIRY